MANKEACELYIEQEIKSALNEGKRPWTIGKELASWVEKLFEVTIKDQLDGVGVIRVQAYTKAAAIAFGRPTVTARELGAVEAIGVRTEDVRDATK